MVEHSNSYPHISLKLTTKGMFSAPKRGGRKPNPITSENLGNRQGHGGKLKSSLSAIIFEAQEDKKQREEDETIPKLNAQRLILQIDPDAFNPEDLKSYGIEIIAELENGYIIGASADLELTELQKRIDKFIKEEWGGNKIAEIWDLIEGKNKPEFILSEKLWQHWDQVQDNQIYTVDIGISCVGTKSQLSDYPTRKSYQSDEKYSEAIQRWSNKRDQTTEEWDDLKREREDEFEKFINCYQGEIIEPFVDDIIPSGANLSDSFSCRIRILGKGLKDLVLNFPYIFDVSEPDEFTELIQRQGKLEDNNTLFELESPDINAPKVCIIDSGIQERHSLLKAAIDFNNSKSWVPNELDLISDYVSNGGHGTRVAGAVIYPRNIPRNGKYKAVCWLQNARILDRNCKLSLKIFPPNILSEIIDIYHQGSGTKIFNHSITGSVPCRTQSMSAWASAIDQLTWKNDILFIVSAGNLPINQRNGLTRLSIEEHLINQRNYPNYLLENSSRISNPAQSFQSLTVGSIAHNSYETTFLNSIAQLDRPSAFSCSGFGIWNSIKPEVVEYGGDLVKDNNQPPNFTSPETVCPELVCSTLNNDPAIASDKVGTSFSTPKVSHIAACLAAVFPNETCLLYRALIVQSARWPAWTENYNNNKSDILRFIGYGIPNLDRARENTANRITLMTQGNKRIKAKEVHIYQIKLPENLRSQGEELEILVEITLSYKAQPRRTRRHHRKYLSTWLDWDCSKKGEDPESFLDRNLKGYDKPENVDKGESVFKWTLGKQKNYGMIKDVSRTSGTIQKDWTIAKSYELRESFCISVVGHEGWNNDPDADVPYCLVVSFEAIKTEIPIYSEIQAAQIQLEVEQFV